MEVTSEIFHGSGWTTPQAAFGRRPRQTRRRPQRQPSQQQNQRTERAAQDPSAVQRVAAASWLPRLPKDQIKVIMRPRGGLDVARVKLMLLPRAINMAAALTEQQVEDGTMCGNKL
ncbi:hypothetical protein HPB52_015995 [Rhipicephalus sanguineus]|uniref:Uncharacterized protein n=1 Tax=Rhipicephalus sanguineus TaxID=34632 RepID=A0A9D4PMU7_RHISA|nr:hypothetical protein HPB52_015995 [Rhipicephalus sanguineus]